MVRLSYFLNILFAIALVIFSLAYQRKYTELLALKEHHERVVTDLTKSLIMATDAEFRGEKDPEKK